MGSGQSPLQPVDAPLLLATHWVMPRLSHAHYRTSWRHPPTPEATEDKSAATQTIAPVGGKVPSDLSDQSDQSDLSDSRHTNYCPRMRRKAHNAVAGNQYAAVLKSNPAEVFRMLSPLTIYIACLESIV